MMRRMSCCVLGFVFLMGRRVLFGKVDVCGDRNRIGK